MRRSIGLGAVALLAASLATAALAVGQVESEAPALINADQWHSQFVTGSTVKVAVVDSGFVGLQSSQASGDIPGSAILRKFTPEDFENGSTNHGVRVAQQLMDMAPGVSLYLIKIDSAEDVDNVRTYVRDNGIRIVVVSMSFFGRSFYDDTGFDVADQINVSVATDKIAWFVNAGNQRLGHQESLQTRYFTSIGDFPDTLTHQLVWDEFPGAQSKYSITTYDAGGGVIQGGSTGPLPTLNGQPPYIGKEFNYNPSGLGGGGPYRVEITKESGPGATVDYICEGCVFTDAAGNPLPSPVQPSSSMVDPAVTSGACTITALDRRQWGEVNPTRSNLDQWSEGPGPSGSEKPEFTAPTALADTFGDIASGNPFFATSASAPVAAGVAALLLHVDPSLDPNDIEQYMRTDMVDDVGSPGHDPQFGYGRLEVPTTIFLPWNPPDGDQDGLPNHVDNCETIPNPSQADTDNDQEGDACDNQCFGNPATTVSSVNPSAGSTPLTLMVAGTGFQTASTVELDGTSLDTTYNSSTSLTAVVPSGAPTGTFNLVVVNPACRSFDDVTVQVTGSCGLLGIEGALLAGIVLVRKMRRARRA